MNRGQVQVGDFALHGSGGVTLAEQGRKAVGVVRVCEGTGQRVQKFVFECQIDPVKMKELERRLLAEIKPAEDNLRLYRLAESRGCEVREHGVFRATNFDGPLVLQVDDGLREPQAMADYGDVCAAGRTMNFWAAQADWATNECTETGSSAGSRNAYRIFRDFRLLRATAMRGED